MQNHQWKYPICFLYLILGILISFVLFQLSSSNHIDNIPALGLSGMRRNSSVTYYSTTYIIIYPLCLFIGSMITGYLCQPYIKSTISFVYLSSGLYLIAFIMPWEITTSIHIFIKFLKHPGVLWIVSSIGGVYLGRYVSRVLNK